MPPFSILLAAKEVRPARLDSAIIKSWEEDEDVFLTGATNLLYEYSDAEILFAGFEGVVAGGHGMMGELNIYLGQARGLTYFAHGGGNGEQFELEFYDQGFEYIYLFERQRLIAHVTLLEFSTRRALQSGVSMPMTSLSHMNMAIVTSFASLVSLICQCPSVDAVVAKWLTRVLPPSSH